MVLAKKHSRDHAKRGGKNEKIDFDINYEFTSGFSGNSERALIR
jgi:hypothetical protein